MKSYRSLPPDLSARAYLAVPLNEAADARMLGCTWDNARHSWWVDRDSIAGTPYVWRWMDDTDPMRDAARKAYNRLEKQNGKKIKSRNRRAGKRAYH